MTDFLNFKHYLPNTISFFQRRFPGIEINSDNWELIFNHLELNDPKEFLLGISFANFIINGLKVSFEDEIKLLQLLLSHLNSHKDDFENWGILIISLALHKNTTLNDKIPISLSINKIKINDWKDFLLILKNNDNLTQKAILNNNTKDTFLFNEFLFHRNDKNIIKLYFTYDDEISKILINDKVNLEITPYKIIDDKVILDIQKVNEIIIKRDNVIEIMNVEAIYFVELF